jgi:hypothetical protein
MGENEPGLEAEAFNLKCAQMFFQSRAPRGHDEIARLQHGPLLARTPAAHHAEAAAVIGSEYFRYGRGFTMGANPNDDAFIAPFHFASKLQTHHAHALRIIGPVFPHFHKQEKMHLAPE